VATLKSFEELECWKEAAQLRMQIGTLIKSFPESEKYLLADQLKRASRSVTANIAEGFGRFHFQDNSQFCRQSRGSLHELLDHLIVALEEQYLTENEFSQLKEKTLKCIGLLNGYINYLQRAKLTKNV
jgi:four helix bundle protein